MNFLKDCLQLSQYPKRSNQLIFKITLTSLVIFSLLFFMYYFVKADLAFSCQNMPNNILVNHEQKYYKINEFEQLESNLATKSKILSQNLNTNVSTSFSLVSTIDIASEPISSQFSSYSTIFTDSFADYTSMLSSDQCTIVKGKGETKNNVIISETLENTMFSGDAFGKKIFLKDYQNAKVVETTITGVFESSVKKSIIFDNSAKKEADFNKHIFIGMNLFYEIFHDSPSSFFPTNFFKFEDDLVASDLDYLNQIFINPTFKSNAENQILYRMSPLMTTINYIILMVLLINLITIVGCLFLRNRDIKDSIFTWQIFFLGRNKTFLLIFLSNLFLMVKGIVISLAISLIIQMIGFWLLGYSIDFIREMSFIYLSYILISLLVSLYFSFSYHKKYILQNYRKEDLIFFE